MRELEEEGLTTGDAQGAADVELMQGRVFDFDPEAPLDTWLPRLDHSRGGHEIH